MQDVDFTPALFGLWGMDGVCVLPDGPEESLGQVAERVVLEVKSAEAVAGGDDLRLVLNGLTVELKAQFRTFRKLRRDAEKALGDEDIDEAAVKIAKADIKAATDAISQIVRTLEKVDNLQRSMAHERMLKQDEAVDQDTLDALCEHFLGVIDARAAEKAKRMVAEFSAGPIPDG